MEVILLERVEKLGQMGEVVNVKPGFARNYLLPTNKALRATKANVAQFDDRRAQFEASNIQKRDEAQSIGSRLEGLSIILVRQASDSDQLYGSVTTRDIAMEVTAAGFTVDKNQVQLNHPIKTVGLHTVTVRLHPEVSLSVTVNVARTEDEAESQARGERPGRMDDDEDDGAAVVAIVPVADDVDLSESARDLLDEPEEVDDSDTDASDDSDGDAEQDQA